MALEPRPISQQKQYDYLLKFLLVGDSDVGKQEILSGLEDGSTESPFCSGGGKNITSMVHITDMSLNNMRFAARKLL
jgi:Ras-related protein Rab-40